MHLDDVNAIACPTAQGMRLAPTSRAGLVKCCSVSLLTEKLSIHRSLATSVKVHDL